MAVSFCLILLGVGRWSGEAQERGGGEEANFTGKTSTLDTAGARFTRRRFEAGARTAWHSHARGQLLFVEEGRLRMQQKGQAIREGGRGESFYTAPDVPHWHGAAANQPLVHSAISYGDTKWMEKVTEAEYAGR
jgi:4-carboxymuconolactone decarboxylase